HLFDHLVLHTLIREQGGAYGAGATCNTYAGVFSFYAYRDPHLSSSLSAMHQEIDKVMQGHFSQEELEAAKLSIIQKLDAPIGPGGQAALAYSRWRGSKTLEDRQNFRDQVLSCSSSQVCQAVAM